MSRLLSSYIGAALVVFAVATGPMGTDTRRARAGELCEPAPPRMSSTVGKEIRGRARSFPRVLCPGVTSIPIALDDSYAPPGPIRFGETNPTARAVGYGLTPLRGWIPSAGMVVQVPPPGRAQDPHPNPLPEYGSTALAAGRERGQDKTGPSDIRFGVVDVFIDSGAAALAAYQFELNVAAGDVTLVGVEGGDPRAYGQPPYYDPAALARQRIVIAAFDLGSDLPRGKTRVARLMVRVRGAVAPAYEATLAVAVGADGKPVAATVSVSDSFDSTRPVSEGAGR